MGAFCAGITITVLGGGSKNAGSGAFGVGAGNASGKSGMSSATGPDAGAKNGEIGGARVRLGSSTSASSSSISSSPGGGGGMGFARCPTIETVGAIATTGLGAGVCVGAFP